MRRDVRSHLFASTLIVLSFLPGCSVKKLAVDKLGDALANGGSAYASDDDPELVRAAVPFGLKTVESLLVEAPRHKGLLYAAASGFVQYAYAFVQQDADFVEAESLSRATELRTRARRLYLRALEYGLRGLEVDLPGFRERLRRDEKAALQDTRKAHVPLLYWTGLAWAGAISLAKDDSKLTADLHLAEALERRALELDEGYALGSIHDFFISYEAGRSSVGGSREEARRHLDRALALAGGKRVFPLVAYAESASVGAQDRQEFERLLHDALAVDPDAYPDGRLSNLVAQRRARWLLARADELFIE
jgi:predicted anti-sigma-YlaC factor YlaD